MHIRCLVIGVVLVRVDDHLMLSLLVHAALEAILLPTIVSADHIMSQKMDDIHVKAQVQKCHVPQQSPRGPIE